MQMGFWLRICQKKDMFDFLRGVLLMARLKTDDPSAVPPVLTKAHQGHYYIGLDSVVTLLVFCEDLLAYGVTFEVLEYQPEGLVIESSQAQLGVEAMIEHAFAVSTPIRLTYRWT